MTGNNIAREDVQALHLYTPAEQRAGTIRLNANEAPESDYLGDSASGLNRYPEVWPHSVQTRMAAHFGVAHKNVLVTRGSSEAIDALIRTYCRAYQDSILTTPPAFELYDFYARVQGASIIKVPLLENDDFAFDHDGVLAACEDHTKVIFICTPNNPTGNLIAVDEILSIVKARRGKSIVAVDEAYIEFSAHPSLASRVDEFDNLVVLRTLSKALGLAGARCGAAIATQATADMIRRVTPPYSFPTPVIDSAKNALAEDRLADAKKFIANIVAERERVAAGLSALQGVEKVWPSYANFLLVRFARLAEVLDSLQAKNILIRAYKDQEALANCARITIGSPAENDALLNTLAGGGQS